jgi:D-alanine-D-alanine ligase
LRVALAYDEVSAAFTGCSQPPDAGSEYEDERTIESLLEAIRLCGHEAERLPLGEDFPERARSLDPDLVFNIAEGVRGPTRESIVPAWLDQLGIPYTGSDGLALAVSLDKALTKTLAAACGVRTPAFRRVRDASDLDDLGLAYPLFVKPNGEGSSMGVRLSSLVETPEDLRRQVAWVLDNYSQDCLVEEFAPGREFCVGIFGNERLQLLPIVEVKSPGSFYANEHKQQHRKELTCPADLPHGMVAEALESSIKVYRMMRCRDFARVDLKLDREERPSFLEINPLPGLSPFYSIFTCQAQAAGMSHEELIGTIIELAWNRSRGRAQKVAT